MSLPTGPSFFAEVANMTYTNPSINSGTAVSCFAVTGVSVSVKRDQLMGYDNNKSRPVAVHSTKINETITIATQDVNFIDVIKLAVGPGTLAFTGKAFAHTTGGTSLPDQAYTYTNFVIESESATKPGHGTASGSISGFTMENSAGDTTDAEVITTGSSSSTGTN